MTTHKSLTGAELHMIGYQQNTDPGAAGAGVAWVDTGTTPPTLKIRDASNTTWEAVGGAPYARVAVANTFTANQTVTGNLLVQDATNGSGLLVTGAGADVALTAPNATAGDPSQSPFGVDFYTQRWNGTATVIEGAYITGYRGSAAAQDYWLEFSADLGVILKLYDARYAFHADVATAPSGSPTAGCFVWVDATSHQLKLKTPAGTTYNLIAVPVTPPSVTGSRGGNAALASLLTQLATLGIITDSTT